MSTLKTIIHHKLAQLVLAIITVVLLYYGYTYRYNLWQFSGLNRVPAIFKKHPEKYCIGCPNLFPDNVATQASAYAHAGEGIVPQEKYAGLKKLLHQGKLKKVENSPVVCISRFDRSWLIV